MKPKNIRYGQYFGKENDNTEFKVFTFCSKGISIDPNDEKMNDHLLVTKNWIFNEDVINNLDHYFESYVPKYSSAFLNSKTDPKKSNMYFGISDDGIVHGIPYNGIIDKDYLVKKLHKILDSNLLISNCDLKKFIDVDIINIDTNFFHIDKFHQNIVEDYFSKKKEFRKNFDKFKSNKDAWFKLLLYYNDKLHNLLNNKNTRREILMYVIKNDPKNHDIISLLKSDKKFPAMRGTDIDQLKTQKNSIWYWVTQWKDYATDFVKSIKPRTPRSCYSKLFPISVLITTIDMIPHWLDKNNINLYLIKFTFNRPDYHINVKYQDKYGNYISCYRDLLTVNNPCCLIDV